MILFHNNTQQDHERQQPGNKLLKMTNIYTRTTFKHNKSQINNQAQPHHIMRLSSSDTQVINVLPYHR
jgi:hypothetical protein